jgi:hypothetical protein
MQSGESERSQNMMAAQEKDKKRLEQLNTRFGKVSEKRLLYSFDVFI